jgi:hypothetical protein
MTSDMTLSGSFLDSRQMQQEVLMWLLHNAGMDVTPRNCIRVSTRQNITEEFSREGRRGRNMRRADWIRGTFGFEVTERVSSIPKVCSPLYLNPPIIATVEMNSNQLSISHCQNQLLPGTRPAPLYGDVRAVDTTSSWTREPSPYNVGDIAVSFDYFKSLVPAPDEKNYLGLENDVCRAPGMATGCTTK